MFTAVFHRFFAAFLTLFVFGAAVKPVSTHSDNSAGLTAVIVSDTHMETNNTARFASLKKTFTGIANYGRDADALIFAGDNTMNGQTTEWLFFYGFLEKAGLIDSKEVIVAQGNHDFGNTDDAATYDKLSVRAINEYNAFTGRNIDKVYYSTVVNGYRIIALGSEKNMEDTVSYISDEQVAFLENELSAADGRPVIIVNHNPLYGTNNPQSRYYFNRTVNDEKIKAAMENYDGAVFFFSGHTHFAVNDNSVVTRENVTYINMPMLSDGAYYPANDECDDAGIGCQLTLFNNYAELSFINYNTGKPVCDYEKITVNY